MPRVALSPAAATGAEVCPASLPLLSPVRIRGPSEPRKGWSSNLCDLEDLCAASSARFPFQKNPLPSPMEKDLLTACAISFSRVSSAFHLSAPIPGAAPGECLSKLRLVKSTLFLGSPPIND